MKPWINTLAMSLVAFACSFSIATAGNTGKVQVNQSSIDDHKVCGNPCPGKGMPKYRVHTMLVSLNITDTPVGYEPPKGPAVPVTLTYNQREAYQPADFTFFNLGKKWNFNWLSYVQDNPQSPGSQVRVYLPGGGTRDYGGYNSSNNTFSPEQRTGAQLVRVTSTNYERRMPDGSQYIYSASDGKQSYPRRIFLSQIRDAAGNAVTLHYDDQNRLIRLTDAIGQETLFDYKNADPLKITHVTDPFGRTADIHYDTSGRLISITDAINMTSTFTYDSGTFISSMTTPYGTTRFSYGQSGTRRWLVITDPEGEKERIEYRHSAPGIPVSDSPLPSGMKLFNRYINSRNTFYWDKEAMKRAPGNYKQARIYHWYHLRTNSSMTTGVLESIKNPLENRIWYNYPGQSWAGAEGTLDKPSKTGQILQDGTTQLNQKSYNSIGNLTQIIDPEGREYRFDYAQNNIDLIRIRQKNSTDFDTLAELTYNESHRLLSYKGPDEQLTLYTYNSSGQLTSQTNALGQMTQYIYNEDGYLFTIIGPNHHTIASYQYDSAGRIDSYTNAAGYMLKYDYDGLDRIIRRTYPDETFDDIQWDKLDMISYTDRYGEQTQYTYNAVQKLIKEIDPALNETNTHYFANGLLASVTDPKSNVTQVLRDIQGRLTTTIHADNTQTTYTYDKTGRQIQSTDPLEGKTLYGYAKDDRLIKVTDPKGNITQYSYDLAGDMTRLDSPDTGISHYAYDLNGNGINNTDAKKQKTQYTYDALNRVKTVTYSDGQVVNYNYDNGPNGIGRLAEINEDKVTTSFAYDKSGKLISRQQTSSDGINLRFMTTYNTAGLPESITYPSGAVISYEYHQERLIGVSYNDTEVLDGITYAAIGAISGWRWGNRLEHFLAYDPNGLLASYSLPEKSLTLDYDALGNLLAIMGDGVSQNFTYDKLDRLKTAQSSEFELAYDYDPNSNRTETSDAGQITPYTYQAGSNKLASHASTLIEYDANGSIVSDGHHVYSYDARGRLIAVDGTATEYHYNDLGQRIAKKSLQRYQLSADLNKDGDVTQADIHQLHDIIDSGEAPLEADLNQDGVVDNHDTACIATLIGKSKNQGKNKKKEKNQSSKKGKGGPHSCHIGEWVSVKQETHFIYDGAQLLGEYDISGQPKQEYLWIGEQLVATIKDGQLYYVHTDQLGAPRAITDTNSTVVWRWDTRPFGDSEANEDPDHDGNNFTFNLRFPGQYADVETGLYYNYHRHYDPTLGRYITSDPIGLEGGLNTYSYVSGNPLKFIDFFGLEANRTDHLVYPPTFRCSIYDNCMSDGDKTGYEWVDNTICDIMPGKNPKIGDFEIPLDIPGKACQQVNKSIKCTQDCWGLCNGD